mgnify:FL=1
MIIFFVIFAVVGNIQVMYLNKKYHKVYKNTKNIENVKAVILKGPIENEYTYKYIVKAKTGQLKNKKFIIYINKNNNKLFKYGDLIKIQGEYSSPQTARNYKGFDYSKYLKTLKIYGIIKIEEANLLKENDLNFVLISINNLKQKMIDHANKNMPQKTANLLLGLLIGQKVTYKKI